MISFDKLKEYFLKRGNKKNTQDLVVILIVGLMIMLVYSFFNTDKPRSSGYVEVTPAAEKTVSNAPISYEDKLESELTDVLEQIHGAGKVKVMIYFDSSSEIVPAFSENDTNRLIEESGSDGGKSVTNESSTSNTIVTTNEGSTNKPLILKEVKPKINGIIVIAEGASDPNVKYKLYEAVRTVFNIEQYRVNIYAMEKNK